MEGGLPSQANLIWRDYSVTARIQSSGLCRYPAETIATELMICQVV